MYFKLISIIIDITFFQKGVRQQFCFSVALIIFLPHCIFRNKLNHIYLFNCPIRCALPPLFSKCKRIPFGSKKQNIRSFVIFKLAPLVFSEIKKIMVLFLKQYYLLSSFAAEVSVISQKKNAILFSCTSRIKSRISNKRIWK